MIGGALLTTVAGLIVNIPLAGIVRTPLAWPALLTSGAVMAAGFFLIAGAPSYALVVAAGIPQGIGRAGFMLLNNALLMATAEPEYHGRVMSLSMIGFGSQALLAPVWGTIADAVGVRTTLVIVGIAACSIVAAGAVSGLATRNSAAPGHG